MCCLRSASGGGFFICEERLETFPAAGVDMASQYDAARAEATRYSWWEERGYFRPDPESDAPPFVITIPPPNVTGDLHLGHALTYGIEDILGRFRRMQGFNTLILPGVDHAGIATQNAVEKQLATDGISRHDLGREAFVERVWAWKDEYAANIRRQFRALGCGFDWSRERFTMDPRYVDAVMEFFIRLYEEEKIYRGWRVINWCIRCHSAISDIEVEDEERQDSLYYLQYPLKNGSGTVSVATVRPETILGDVAVAVHPDDPRFTDLVGQIAILPLLGRELPIVADTFVDSEFGSGAVKITPAHDFADWEVAARHNLPMPIAISPEATITAVGEQYEGLGVVEARERILNDLQAAGAVLKVEAYQHRVPTCERCGTVLEPLLSEQWFMHMRELAALAIEAAESGDVSFVPERWTRIYLEWLEHIRPWTLSRQLWWGHRVPVYYCDSEHATAAKSWPDACSRCGCPIVRQDEDVLDTWFSSALWPFATLGWPQETTELTRYYPTSFMNTSSQIIYLWIARMVMTGMKFRGEVPFPTVLINPTILTKDGRRMSKSLGTGVDPLDLVAEYGADVLRFGLMTSGSTHQQDIRFAPERIEQARNFANKIWNVARFVLSNQQVDDAAAPALLTADRWIISRLNAVTASVTADLDRYEFNAAGNQLHAFLWNEFADWYVEMSKSRLYGDDPQAGATVRAVLWSVLDRMIRLLHPYMPFLTEEIWQHLRLTPSVLGRRLSGWDGELPESVMIAPWPASAERDRDAEEAMGLLMGIVREVRTVRAEYHVDPGKFISATVVAPEGAALAGAANALERLARLRPVTISSSAVKTVSTVSLFVGEVSVYLPLADLTDVAAERLRLAREVAEVEKAVTAGQSKLGNEKFRSRAPEQVVARERERLTSLEERLANLRDRLAALNR